MDEKLFVGATACPRPMSEAKKDRVKINFIFTRSFDFFKLRARTSRRPYDKLAFRSASLSIGVFLPDLDDKIDRAFRRIGQMQ